MTKRQFLETRIGRDMCQCVRTMVEVREKLEHMPKDCVDYKYLKEGFSFHVGRWETYRVVLRELLGEDYVLYHTKDCFGVCTTHAEEWLYKVDRQADEAGRCG